MQGTTQYADQPVTERASAGPVTAPVRHSQRQRRAWADIPEWVDPGSPVRYLAAQRER